jgi:hypothetical protein
MIVGKRVSPAAAVYPAAPDIDLIASGGGKPNAWVFALETSDVFISFDGANDHFHLVGTNLTPIIVRCAQQRVWVRQGAAAGVVFVTAMSDT